MRKYIFIFVLVNCLGLFPSLTLAEQKVAITNLNASYLPLQALTTQFGYQVEWNQKYKAFRLNTPESVILFRPNYKTAYLIDIKKENFISKEIELSDCNTYVNGEIKFGGTTYSYESHENENKCKWKLYLFQGRKVILTNPPIVQNGQTLVPSSFVNSQHWNNEEIKTRVQKVYEELREDAVKQYDEHLNDTGVMFDLYALSNSNPAYRIEYEEFYNKYYIEEINKQFQELVLQQMIEPYLNKDLFFINKWNHKVYEENGKEARIKSLDFKTPLRLTNDMITKMASGKWTNQDEVMFRLMMQKSNVSIVRIIDARLEGTFNEVKISLMWSGRKYILDGGFLCDYEIDDTFVIKK